MAMSGTRGSLATELSRGGHGCWRAGDAPHAGLRGGNTDLNPRPGPGAPMFLVTPGETTVSLSLSVCACHPAQHAGSRVPDQGLNLCPCSGSMES